MEDGTGWQEPERMGPREHGLALQGTSLTYEKDDRVAENSCRGRSGEQRLVGKPEAEVTVVDTRIRGIRGGSREAEESEAKSRTRAESAPFVMTDDNGEWGKNHVGCQFV